MDDARLETDRLILMPPSARDLDDWAAFSAEADTMTHIGGLRSRSEAWRDLCTMAGAWTVRGFAMFSVYLKEGGGRPGQWIGRVGPWQPEGWPGTEVGWGVARAFAGRGVALEAAVASIDFAFDRLGWQEVIHCIAPDNVASIRLAERLGSTNLGPTRMPEPFHEHAVDKWGQTRDQWRANRARFD